MIKFNGVNHLAMATGDMDKTIRFWRDLLGMSSWPVWVVPDTGTTFLRFRSTIARFL